MARHSFFSSEKILNPQTSHRHRPLHLQLYRQQGTQPLAKVQREAVQGPVVQRPTSANPGLDFNPGFFTSFFQILLGKNFPSRFLEHPMIKLKAKRFELNLLLKLTDLASNSTLTLGYLNPALNNPGLVAMPS